MSLSTSPDQRDTREDTPAPAVSTRAVFWVGTVVTGALFLWGAWERRWIADDGLIVLRTVRNLLAGNGPVLMRASGSRSQHQHHLDVPRLRG